MAADDIIISGARENNLKNVSLRIPKRRLTVFTGVSGSGKSSIVFDTIAAEAQRQLNETFTAFARTFLPRYGQPEVDTIENLSAAIVVDQKRLGGGSRSTVGTITDIFSLLRLLYSRVGKPYIGYSNAFSFNDPPGHVPGVRGSRQYGPTGPRHLPRPVQVAERWRPVASRLRHHRLVLEDVRRLRLLRPRQEALRLLRAGVAGAAVRRGGRRFSDEVLLHKLRGKSISDVLTMPAAEALEFFTEPKLRKILQAINDVGLDYLRLGQPVEHPVRR